MSMNVLFVEAFRQSAIPVKIGLPYAYLAISSHIRRKSSRYKLTFHSYLLEGTLGLRSVPFAEILRGVAPSVVMAGAFTSTFGSTHALLGEAKRYGATTVLGGTLASSDYDHLLRSHPDIDVAVIGEGEATCLDVLDTIYEERSLHGVAGIAYRSGDVVVFNGPRSQGRRVPDRLSHAELSTVPLDAYRRVLQRHYVFASRGCRFNCSFCTVGAAGRVRPSYRRPGDIVAEYSAACDLLGSLVTSLADSNVTDNPPY